MGRVMIGALKAVIALSVLGSLIVQAGLVTVVRADLSEVGVPIWAQVALIVVVFAGVITMQVFAWCVWRLLTLARKGAVFSDAAFTYINAIAAAFGVAALLAFTLAILLAPGVTAPGIVGLICGTSLVLGGISMLSLVMRQLLRQAIERETENHVLRSELDEVV